MWKQALMVLLDYLFNIYIFILLLRFFLQLVRADFYNPLTQWMIKLAKPLVWPLQKIIPDWRNVNFAALIAVIIIEVLKITILTEVGVLHLPHWLGAIIWAGGDAVNHTVNLFFFVILIQTLLSWLRPQGGNPFVEVLYRLTIFVLRPLHKIIPPMGGVDFSPIVALLLLKCVSLFIAYPMMAYGLALV